MRIFCRCLRKRAIEFPARVVLALGLLIAALFSSTARADECGLVRLATTTSTSGAGLTDRLLPLFEARTGCSVALLAVGSGKALRLARTGRVDVLLVHAPESEKQFMANGHGLSRHPVMANRYVIAGPSGDPGGLKDAALLEDALRRIARSSATFVSRGDDSGTHKKELSLWEHAKVRPITQDWYYETGTSQRATLARANELQAYVLIDLGTWLANKKNVDLVITFEKSPLLANPYHIIAVNPTRHEGINAKGAKAFIDWMTGDEGQTEIAEFRLEGEQLFVPVNQTSQRPGQ